MFKTGCTYTVSSHENYGYYEKYKNITCSKKQLKLTDQWRRDLTVHCPCDASPDYAQGQH